MKRTARQLSETTIADMYRALDTRRPVTLTYTKADGTQTVRTIEIHEIRTTSAGNVILRAADRQSGEMRTWRIDRVEAYTIHRGRYLVELPASERPQLPAPRTADELTTREIARDDREYWLTRYDTAA